jgi:hypothetical protein
VIPYDLAIAIGLIAETWLLALVVLRSRRPWLKAIFAALGLALIVNGTAFVGTSEGFLPRSWDSTILWTMILSHPLVTILVLGLLHGEGLLRRRPVAFLLLLAVPELLFLVPGSDWAVRHAYDLNPLGGYLIACLAIALAEAIYQRFASSLLAPEGSWLVVAVVMLIIGGPVYAYEFEALGFAGEAGANLAAPVAFGIFVAVALHTDPYSIPRARRGRWSGDDRLARGQTYVFEEARPKYALRALREEALSGRPALLLARASMPPSPPSEGLAFACLEPSRRAALRALSTASQFLAEHPGGLVGVGDLGDLLLMSGGPNVRELAGRLRHLAKETQSTVLLSAARLLEEEKDGLRGIRAAWWPLPDPRKELEAILGRSFGPGARQLLASFAQTRGLHPDDLTTDHVPAFIEFLHRAIAELGRAAADGAAHTGLRDQTASAVQHLQGFAALSPAELAQGDWPSKEAENSDAELLVTAADYWKGKEADELFAAAQELGAQEPLYEMARSIFVEQFGDAGEGILKSEIAKLGRRPEDLRPEDVTRLADRASVDLISLADVVDVPQAKTRIRTQIDLIRRRLEAIAEERP